VVVVVVRPHEQVLVPVLEALHPLVMQRLP